MVSSAAGKFSIKENVTDGVLSVNLRSGDAAEFNIAFGRNMRPDHAAMNVGDSDLATHGFQIDGGINRYLQVKIDVTNVASSAIVRSHVNNQSIARLPWRQVGFRGFKRSGQLDLVAVPRFHRDSAGNIFQLDTDIFPRWISFRHTLLRVDAAQAERAKSEQGHEHYKFRINMDPGDSKSCGRHSHSHRRGAIQQPCFL